MDAIPQSCQSFHENGELFASANLCDHKEPQYRRVVISEASVELSRMQDKGRGSSSGYMHTSVGVFTEEVCRSVFIKVIALAYQDIVLAMKRPDPRFTTRKGPGASLVNQENYDFRSAVSFFFMQSKAFDSQNRFRGYFSAFNSYCVLLGLDAPRARRTLLDAFPTLEALVQSYIPNPDFRAAVGSVGLCDTRGFLASRTELFL